MKHWNRPFTHEDIRMESKHMKRCSTLVTREMEIKATMRCYYTFNKMTKIKKYWPCDITELFYIAAGNAKWYSTVKMVWQFKHALNLQYSNSILKIHPAKMNMSTLKTVCSGMFINSSILTAQNKNQPNVFQ